MSVLGWCQWLEHTPLAFASPNRRGSSADRRQPHPGPAFIIGLIVRIRLLGLALEAIRVADRDRYCVCRNPARVMFATGGVCS